MDLPAGVGVVARQRPAHGFLSLLRKSFSAHGIYLAIVAVYYAGYLTVLRLYPNMQPSDFLLMAAGFIAFSMPLMFMGLGFMRFYHIAVHVKPERPVAALIADLKAFLSDRGRLAHGLPMVVIMILFMYVFVELKANIPLLNPYSWDVALAEADRVLHFGRQPWEWLQPVLGYVPITFLMNINYNAWFAIMWMVWVFFAFSDRASETRTRFFLTFFVAWIVGGGLLAIYFSSVGPAFYGRLGLSPDPFAPLMSYLRGANEIVPIWAIPVQDMLWQGYQGQSVIDGISGMPSMHNGTALLFALAGFKVNRGVGWLLMGHAILIFLGSILLAWHYAVDTYAAWALVLILWAAMAPVARWWHGRRAHIEFADALAMRA
ncbi:MAG: phosphatase PAP2 family protein [Rhizobiales bacterium]|nr:phosphatase PAP2 family protein [Hyphomicrobiales bacterium]